MQLQNILGAITLASMLACSSGTATTSDAGGNGDSAQPADASDPGAQFKSACDAYGKAVCAREWACGQYASVGYDAFRLSAIIAETQQGCVDGTSAACVAEHVQKGVAETPQDIEACAQKTTTTCTDVPPKCSKKGTLADGAACALPIQCASGVCKRAGVITPLMPAAECGKCGAAAVMDACDNQYECQGAGNNLYCSKTGNGCDTIKKENDTCASKDFLEQGLVCSATVTVKGPGVGAMCIASECGQGLRCDMMNTCVARQVVGEGMDCTSASCTPELSCNSNKCEKTVFASEGGACGIGMPCKGGLTCDANGTCKKAVYVPTCN